MLYSQKLYTTESVTSGHPDKVCDQISDAILDACLKEDAYSRVAIETFGGHGLVVVGGEVTTNARVDYGKIAEDVYRDIGYSDSLRTITNVIEQSPDIAQGVDTGGAGDQGIMYGYATKETEQYMPRSVIFAHALTKGLEDLRRKGTLPWLSPDGKAQVTLEDGRVKTVLVSTQHAQGMTREDIQSHLIEHLIKPTIGDLEEVQIYVNPTGVFVRGGFDADTGLTGRKIMVDTYGGLISHGGGAFSGKDATKVDRSAAYMARFVAKNLVANGYANTCVVSVAYAIGHSEPLMVEAINEHGGSLGSMVREKFDFRPQAIIERLNLRRPLYRATAAYGHFGRDGFPWEEVISL